MAFLYRQTIAGGRSNCSAAAPNTRVTSGWSSPTSSLARGKGEWVARASGGEGLAVPGVVAGAGMAGAGSALACASPLVSVVVGGLCVCIGLEGGGDTDACD